MRILLTGGTGFLGQEIQEYFAGKHEILAPTRSILNLTDADVVDSYFIKQGPFDIVMHTAFNGANGDSGYLSDLTENLKMFENIRRYWKYMKTYHEPNAILFNFCSGAALDRSREISNDCTFTLDDRIPKDYYGLAKNIIARELRDIPSAYNFRLFGCFGKHEAPTRLIKNSLTRLKEGKQIHITKDRRMSFISATDMCRVLEYYIENKDKKKLPKDINLVYKKTYQLTEIADIIKDLTGSEKDVIVDQKMITSEMSAPKSWPIPDYEGSSHNLSMLPVKLQGMEKGIEEVMEYVNRQKAEDS